MSLLDALPLRGVWYIETPPPAELAPESYAARLYLALAPLAQQDEWNDWSLLVYCNALGSMFQLVEDLVRDTPEGVGWSPLLDVNRCPAVALPWLAQLVGVRLLPGASDAENRARIASTAGFKRGTAAAMTGAAAATLTGRKKVVFRERDWDTADTPNYAYYLTVRTYINETPNAALTLQALVEQKPAGIILDYAALPGQDYTTLRTTNANYNAVKAKYPNYSAVVFDEP